MAAFDRLGEVALPPAPHCSLAPNPSHGRCRTKLRCRNGRNGWSWCIGSGTRNRRSLSSGIRLAYIHLHHSQTTISVGRGAGISADRLTVSIMFRGRFSTPLFGTSATS